MKGKKGKSLLSIVLVSILILPSASGLLGSGNRQGPFNTNDKFSPVLNEKKNNVTGMNELQNIIVELSGDPLAKSVYREKKSVQEIDAVNSLREMHKEVAEEIKNIPRCTIRRDYRLTFNGMALTVPANEIPRIKGLSEVKKIYTDGTNKLLLNQSVPLIEADKVWQLHDSNGTNVTGKGVIVSVIDTGIDYNHPDLGGPGFPNSRVIGGYDFVNNDSDPMDDHNHGTHCAGIIGANGTLKGVAPDVQFLAYKAFSSSGYGSTSDCIAAIEASVENGSDVISMSWGGDEKDPDSPLSQALHNSMDLGVICVAAAGNSGPDYETISWPAGDPDVIAVGATGKGDVIASFSSRGPSNLGGIKPEVLAPGVNIYSTIRNGDYGYMSGTSMACPHVSGSAALLLQQHPDWKQNDVKRALMNGAVDLGYNVYAEGAGRIDVYSSSTEKLEVSPSVIDLGRITYKEVAVLLKNSGATAVAFNTSINCTFAPPFWDDVMHYSVDYVGVSPAFSTVEANSTMQLNLTFNVPADAEKGYYLGKMIVFADDHNYSVLFSFGFGRDMIINATENLTNMSVIVNGNISIEETGNFQVENVTFIMTGLYSGQYAIQVKDGGNLSLYNSTITSYSHSFKNRVKIYGSAIIEHSNVNRTNGINIYSDNVRIANSTIKHDWKIVNTGLFYVPGHGHLIYSFNSSPEIYGNKITLTPNFYGGYTYNDGELPHFQAIYLKNSSARIINNSITLELPLSVGIYSVASSPLLETNDISLKHAQDFGIYAVNSNIVGENMTIGARASLRYTYGLEEHNSSTTLFNSSISLYNSACKNVRLYEHSYALLVNVTSQRDSYYRSDDSYLYIKWFLNVEVVNRLNEPLAGVNVIVNDTYNHTVFSGKSGYDGWVKDILCTQRIATPNTTVEYGTYNVTTYNKTEMKYANPQPDMYKTQNVLIILGDNRTGIRINSDTEFKLWSKKWGWTGDGTATNPYIIENYDINARGGQGAIYIGNTTLHFIIRNCKVYNTKYRSSPYFAGFGIALYNTENGFVLNNIVFNNDYYGIWLGSSKNNIIFNNQVYNNGVGGIYLDSSCRENKIYKNTVTNSKYGIRLISSTKNTLTKNLLSNNKYGIFLSWSDTSDNFLTYNNASNNDFGIYVDFAGENRIIDNIVYKNAQWGIYLYSANENLIAGNNFLENKNQSYDKSGDNRWNASYPNGGNYWSDYNGTDLYSGPNQNISGSDGIGDTPYTHIRDGDGAQDNYPLMAPKEVEVFDIPVHLGWNLISFPLSVSDDIETVLTTYDVIWDYAQWYNPADSGDHWKTHLVGRSKNDLNTIGNTMGLWLHVTDAGDGYLRISGEVPNSTTIQLHAGWNLVSYPASDLTAMSRANLPSEVTKIAKYDSRATYLISEVTDWVGSNFVPGRGYWLYATADTTWTVNY